MSLTVAYKIAQSGIAQAEKKLSVLSGNINNADQAGYTRKTYQSTVIGNVPSGGTVVQAAVDTALAKSVAVQSTAYYQQSTIADYLNNYSDAFGSTASGSTTLSSAVTSLTTALQSLESNASELSSQTAVVNAATQLASQLNSLSQTLQSARQDASDAIGTSIDTINSDLKTIVELNQSISKAGAQGADTANLIDQRNLALQDLSQQLGIQYFSNEQGQITVYSSAGDLLVGSYAAQLSYTNSGTTTSDSTYPGTISGIILNGEDITTRIRGGTLGGLITVRDTTLPAEQAKLDELTSTLATTVNAALSEGASLPPRNSLEGETVVDATDTLGASGSWRIAVTDQQGKVFNVVDLDLTSYATVGDLVTALNGISGVTASIDASGHLVVGAADSSQGISLNQMDSTIGGMGATQYFGLNNLFKGDDASNIRVSDYLRDDASALATGSLSDSATLAINDTGISSGDSSVATALVDAITGSQTFSAAGNFGTRKTSLANYAAAIISNAAAQASTAQSAADTTQATYTYLSEKLANETGVNIDEETANMTALQNSYSASATLISTIRDMFTSLLSAVQ